MPVKNTFLICTRDSDPKGNFTSEPGETVYLRVPPGHDDYTIHRKMSRASWSKAVIAAADGEEDAITGSRGNILFFVHGYNNDRETVLWRTRTLQDTLSKAGWNGVVVGFDWPSDNSTLNYLEDRSDAAKVALRLVDDALRILIEAQFPREQTTPTCTLNVHLVGHSTGAYVIMEAFANAEKDSAFFKKSWRLGQVAFIGGDVSSASLSADSDWARPMFSRILRLTNYSNGFDKVLGVSNMKRLGTSPRAGRVGLPEKTSPKSVNVDCTDYFATKDPDNSTFKGTFNHSWHIGDSAFALDLALTLEGGIDRNAIPTRQLDNGKLKLQGGQSRPKWQSRWDATHPAGE